MRTLISIDWDFHVPEDLFWDLGHRENLFFLHMVWSLRMGLYAKIKTSGTEKNLWDWLRARVNLDGRMLAVSDSHASAYSLAEDVDHVTLIDAHHDCWVGQDSKGIYCDNWLRQWLKGDKKRRILWVMPRWQTKAFELPHDVKQRIDVVEFSEDLKLSGTSSRFVHVARSGCWTPPWLDDAFLDFLKGFGRPLKEALVMQDGDWNPLKRRWDKETLERSLESHRQHKALGEEIMKKKPKRKPSAAKKASRKP